MATKFRKTHFLIQFIADWINSLKRTVAAGGAGGSVTGTSASTTPGAGGGTAPAFTGTAHTRAVAVADLLTGTGWATVGQVITTTETNITATLNQYAGCWFLGATQTPCLIVSHPAVVAGALALTVRGAAPATNAETFGVLAGPTPAGTVASHTHTGAAHTHGAGTFAAAPASGAVHYDQGEYTIAAADASNLATSRTLILAIGVAYHEHVNDALAHDTIDSDNDIIDLGAGEDMQSDFFTPVAAANLATLCGLANDIKAAYNLHRSQSGVHPTDDSGHAIASADATDQSSLNTLLNEIKTDFNLHIADGFATPSWRVAQD